jgi:ABC-type Mn2+/Zn2+ transport system ATPase subunit
VTGDSDNAETLRIDDAETLRIDDAETIRIDHADLGHDAKVVLGDVNLTVRAGELVGVVGRSGAGKSTLLAALAGAPVQLSGTVVVRGLDPRRSDHPVGLVPQMGDETPTRLSVVELIALGSPRTGLFTTRRERSEAGRLLERLGLEGMGRRRITELSGGQRQRVAIARALTASSTLLLCDEPTSGADPTLAAEIVDVLTDVARNGTTVLVATHDLSGVASRLDRVIGIGSGRVCFDGPAASFGPEQFKAVYANDVKVGTQP